MTILVCGDALFDFFQTEAPAPGRLTFDARAGGSPLNVAIGLARLGAPSAFFAGVSTDLLGARLAEYLESEGVATDYLVRSDRPTTVSLVGLDASGGPSYAFYASGTADVSLTEADPPALGPDIRALHFGSYSIAAAPTADALAALAARHSDKFVSLDPNVRPTIEPDRAVWRRRIDRLRASANLIKASVEDLAHLAPETPPADVARAWAADGADLVVLTDGDGRVVAFRGERELGAAVPAVEVVDTVGAGDSFQAAVLAELCRRDALSAGLGGLCDDAVAEVLAFAVRAAAVTCARRGADLPRVADVS